MQCFYLSWLKSFPVFKKEIKRIWLKILRNIAIMCDFDENLEKFKF